MHTRSLMACRRNRSPRGWWGLPCSLGNFRKAIKMIVRWAASPRVVSPVNLRSILKSASRSRRQYISAGQRFICSSLVAICVQVYDELKKVVYGMEVNGEPPLHSSSRRYLAISTAKGCHGRWWGRGSMPVVWEAQGEEILSIFWL